MSELARRLQAVDPNLKVVPASHHRRKTRDAWDDCGGVFCPQCGEETMQLVNGVCPRCDGKEQFDATEKMEKKARERHLFSIFSDRRRAARR